MPSSTRTNHNKSGDKIGDGNQAIMLILIGIEMEKRKNFQEIFRMIFIQMKKNVIILAINP